jgi:hypothetical protein
VSGQRFRNFDYDFDFPTPCGRSYIKSPLCLLRCRTHLFNSHPASSARSRPLSEHSSLATRNACFLRSFRPRTSFHRLRVRWAFASSSFWVPMFVSSLSSSLPSLIGVCWQHVRNLAWQMPSLPSAYPEKSNACAKTQISSTIPPHAS